MSEYRRIRVADAGAHVGEPVEIAGWLYNLRKSGKIIFPLVRDGSGILQGVALKSSVAPEVFEMLKDLTQESSLMIRGRLRAEERAPGGYEMDVESAELVQRVPEETPYPITPKEHGIEFLMDHRHLWLRSRRQHAILRVRHEIVKAIRDYFDSNGFTLVDTPIFTPAACEGTTTLFEVCLLYTSPEPGEKLVQPELARTLERIAHNGAQEFYTGETAERLAAQMQANGGLITLADLKNYQAVERRPLAGVYKGYGILTAPPPSSGGVALLEMLGLLEGTGYEKPGAGSAASTHYLAEVMRRAYADRAEFLGDSDFVHVPVSGLLNPRYLAGLRATIDPARATPSTMIGHGAAPQFESGQTTHFNVIDADGNAVALTYTLNGGYGNGVTVPGLGFLLNNEMDDFAAKPGTPNLFGLIQGEANAIAPRKRPLSSMTPVSYTHLGCW